VGVGVLEISRLVEVRLGGRIREGVLNVVGPGCTPTGEQVVMCYDTVVQRLHVTSPQGKEAANHMVCASRLSGL
jgi:hypothetical protein